MKKKLALLLVLTLVIAMLSGCANSAKSEEAPTDGGENEDVSDNSGESEEELWKKEPM